MKVELPQNFFYNINKDLKPKVKRYATLEGARTREGEVYAWDFETGDYINV